MTFIYMMDWKFNYREWFSFVPLGVTEFRFGVRSEVTWIFLFKVQKQVSSENSISVTSKKDFVKKFNWKARKDFHQEISGRPQHNSPKNALRVCCGDSKSGRKCRAITPNWGQFKWNDPPNKAWRVAAGRKSLFNETPGNNQFWHRKYAVIRFGFSSFQRHFGNCVCWLVGRKFFSKKWLKWSPDVTNEFSPHLMSKQLLCGKFQHFSSSQAKIDQIMVNPLIIKSS